MIWFLVARIFSTLVSLIQFARMAESDKDLEIMILRYQLAIAERKMKKPVRANRAERMTLAALAGRLKNQTNRPANQFRQLIQLVQPETVLRWYRDLVRRYWKLKSKPKGRKPCIPQETIDLIKQMAIENRRWGAKKIHGELLKLGIVVHKRTIQRYLRQVRRRNSGQNWATFLRNRAQDI